MPDEEHGIAPAPLGGEEPTFIERFHISPVLFVFLVLAAVFFLYQVLGGLVTYIVAGSGVTAENARLVRGLTAAAELLLMFLPALAFARLASHRVAPFVRYRSASLWLILASLIGLLALQEVLQVYLYLQDQMPVPRSIAPVLEQFKNLIEETYRLLVTAHSPAETLVVVVTISLVPALCEETLFRGVVLHSLEKEMRPGWAVGLSAILFAGFHFDPFAFVPLMVLGGYFGFLTVRSGSIYPAMTAHFANNAVAVLAVFYGIDDRMIVGAAAQKVPTVTLFLNIVVFSAVFMGALAAVLRLTHRRGGHVGAA
ncbi:MAG: hypothetical protein COS95_02435 [Ignavibacteriales bacterium CG07_land_8_20_14_0_80_59_12]|jgi:hypothetical protein|nr:MAG: hypothetical protein COS95_02435 [Ignavibacteriales bacterium CG07_land_8_20_14_0_80_59_12]